MNDRFHRAAKDGYLEPLKEATKKDLNTRDDGGMTPTLWAAYHGNLDALRTCCSRGGDPDRCDYTGNTALHFAAANGHLNCLIFLIKLGANIWQMDNDYHTIMDIAAIREKQDCVRYLDEAIGKQKSLDKKKVENLQIKAKKDAEKRIKLYEKMQLEHQKRLSKMRDKKMSDNVGDRGRQKKNSVIGANSNGQQTFSEATYVQASSSRTSTQKKIKQQKLSTASTYPLTDDFRVSSDRGRSVNSIAGVPSGVPGVMYMPSETMSARSADQATNGPEGRRRNLRNVFPSARENVAGTTRSTGSSVFGTMALRSNFGSANAMYSAARDAERQNSVDPDIPSTSSMGFNGTGAASTMMSLPTGVEETYESRWSESDDELPNGLDEPTELDTFLATLDLTDYSQIFKDERMDMEALMHCNSDDLKELGLHLGPRKKILNALSERKAALELAKEMELTKF